MYEVIPAILEKEWSAIERKLALVKPFAKTVHIDVIDGKFAPNTTFLDPKPFAPFSKDFLLEAHLMVEEPIDYIASFAASGFQRFLGHVESMSDQGEFVAAAQEVGEAGLAVDGPTSVEAIQVSFNDLDALLIMTIKAGFSGQPFEAGNLQKVQELANATPLPIEVDGGMSDITIIQAKNAGATRFAASSFLFGADDLVLQYEKLVSSCHLP